MIIIPDLFSPYVEGVETARKANWHDLTNYIDVQEGQLGNLKSLATFDAEVNKAYEDLDAQALENMMSQMNADIALARMPGALSLAEAFGNVYGDPATAVALNRAKLANTLSSYHTSTADLQNWLNILTDNKNATSFGNNGGTSNQGTNPPGVLNTTTDASVTDGSNAATSTTTIAGSTAPTDTTTTSVWDDLSPELKELWAKRFVRQ